MGNNGFFDSFFLFVVILVAAFTLIDWLLGERNRVKMRETAFQIWFYLGANSYTRVAEDGISSSKYLLDSVFGRTALGVRRLSSSVIVTALVFGLASVIHYYSTPSGVMLYIDQIDGVPGCPEKTLDRWYVCDVEYSYFFGINIRIMPQTVLAVYISSFVSSFLLGRMISRGWLLRTILFILDVSIALFLLLLFFVVLSFTSYTLLDAFIYSTEFTGKNMIALIIVFLVSSVLPILFYLIVFATIVASKPIFPVVFPVVKLVLQRFHESKKGVLTNIAVFLGALMKIIQEVLKHL